MIKNIYIVGTASELNSLPTYKLLEIASEKNSWGKVIFRNKKQAQEACRNTRKECCRVDIYLEDAGTEKAL